MPKETKNNIEEIVKGFYYRAIPEKSYVFQLEQSIREARDKEIIEILHKEIDDTNWNMRLSTVGRLKTFIKLTINQLKANPIKK